MVEEKKTQKIKENVKTEEEKDEKSKEEEAPEAADGESDAIGDDLDAARRRCATATHRHRQG